MLWWLILYIIGETYSLRAIPNNPLPMLKDKLNDFQNYGKIFLTFYDKLFQFSVLLLLSQSNRQYIGLLEHGCAVLQNPVQTSTPNRKYEKTLDSKIALGKLPKKTKCLNCYYSLHSSPYTITIVQLIFITSIFKPPRISSNHNSLHTRLTEFFLNFRCLLCLAFHMQGKQFDECT